MGAERLSQSQKRSDERMSRQRSVVLLAVALLTAISLAMNTTYATASPMQRRWYGFQVPDPNNPGIFAPDLQGGFIEIYGGGMIVTRGYKFGDIEVAYETIDYMWIGVSIQTLLQEKHPNIYDYPHHGYFTWYDKDGEVVGTGEFSNGNGGPPYAGDLHASIVGSEIVVEGRYKVTKWSRQEFFGVTMKFPAALVHTGTWQ